MLMLAVGIWMLNEREVRESWKGKGLHTVSYPLLLLLLLELGSD
jgi:predicted ribosome-associated RNA-binding protein Tma20